MKTIIYLGNRMIIEVPSIKVEEIKRIVPPEVKIEAIKTDNDFFRKAADEFGQLVWRKKNGK